MNDRRDEDIERRLRQLSPPVAPAELRGAVMADELDAAPGLSWAVPSWTARAVWGVAALLLVAIGLTAAGGVLEQRRLARMVRPRPPSRALVELSDMVAEITERQSADRLREYWTRQTAAAFRVAGPREIERMFSSAMLAEKDNFDE